MGVQEDIAGGLRSLLLEYERLDAGWRAQYGLNANEKLVLVLLAEGITPAPTDLSRAVAMTTAGMTGLLDRLESEGFLRRERHATDGRRVMVSLTKKGFQAHLAFQDLMLRVAEVFAAYDERDLAVVRRFLADAGGALARARGVN